MPSTPRVGASRRFSATVRTRGVALVYITIAFIVLTGMVSLGVDYGRVQLAKTELQRSADAAARYAVTGLSNVIAGQSAAAANAAAVVAENTVDGSTVAMIASEDVAMGVFDSSNQHFTVTNDPYEANAVRVTLRKMANRNNAVPLTFAALLGQPSCDITATSIARIDYGATGTAGAGRFDYFIPATSNPWLSGQPAGTIANPVNPHNNPDFGGEKYIDDGSSFKVKKDKGHKGKGSSTSGGSSESNYELWGDYAAKKSSPIEAGGLTVAPGTTMTFDGINGGANNMDSDTLFSGDGNTSWIASNIAGAENGIGDVSAPINSIVAVFLDESTPSGPAPSTLDFSNSSGRDFQSLAPQLRQVFFIGDGRRDSGEVQRFVVPQGAKRLYIGTMDTYEWNNNNGGFQVTAHVNGKITTVIAKN